MSGRITANAHELRGAIGAVEESARKAEAMFADVERRLEAAAAGAGTHREKERIMRKLAEFRAQAAAALKQIRENAKRTNSAFSRRLGMVTEKRS